MSLINKMLQDLDARGGSLGDAATPRSVRAVSRDTRRSPLLLAGGALLLVVLAVGGYVGWRTLKGSRAIPAAAVPAPVKTVHLGPPPSNVVAPAPQTTEVALVPEPAVPAQPAVAEKAAKPPPPVEAQPAQATPPRVRKSTVAPAVAAERAEPVAPIDQPMSPRQRAESAYRRALASVREGRSAEAIGMLEQALDIDAGHEAARQTLVGLLIANKRSDEAVRLLQQGLDADPRQPAMAMLLARLQIERGGAGIDTLQRSLPFANASPEYQAFLAGALQRQQRHREATEQYQAALRAMPNNGVWLMGLGISLQAENRTEEARDAFGKARAAGNLTPELQLFVEKKLQQLSH